MSALSASVFIWNVTGNGQGAADIMNVLRDRNQKWEIWGGLFVLWMFITEGSVASNVITHTKTNAPPSPALCTSLTSQELAPGGWEEDMQEIFSKNEHHPTRYMLSQNIMPLLLGYQFCSRWKRGRKSKVTQGVILMGPVMRVDRLRRGGGWALTRCCLQIGFLQVRHPRWVISPLEQPLSYRMICY